MNNSQGDRKQQVQELLTKAERYLHKMFLAGCIFGALSCFGRADFNLPLYAFLYIMWDQDDVSNLFLPTVDTPHSPRKVSSNCLIELVLTRVFSDLLQNNKLKLMLLLAITFVGDLFWLFYWVPHWWSSEMGKV